MKARKMKNDKGFTIIEISVVFVIVGIVLALVIAQFTGVSYKNKVEADVKVLYSDIVEMKLKSYAEHYDSTLKKEKNYGVYWNTGTFTTYYKYYFTDADNNGAIDISEFYAPSQSTVTLTRSMSVCGSPPPDGIMFSGRGILRSASSVYIYAKCAECDQSVDPVTCECGQSVDPVTGKCVQSVDPVTVCRKVADQSALCNDVNYPEYSCIAISLVQVKTGKWCDKNKDGVFDPDPDPAISECQFR
jgi:prepilin-type N-terminal cleavage/methylation domain-containing protein